MEPSALGCPVPRDRFPGRERLYPWIYKIREDFVFQSIHRGKTFHAEWLRLEPDGTVTIKANATGYAWDGCTPKFSVLGLFILGTPDGHIDIETGKSLTYHASLVHDAFYQYLEDVPIPKREIDRQFYDMLKERRFPLAWLYYRAVLYFGGWGVKQRNL
ncbi:hypothetical protein [Synechococcus sp. CBW1002]|jgi:hypothetical protein|uniref:hypothetical protein n=1 Tax=Synechococcus sp. CBW1002 TaxID=1353134 RepID=UPI0018CE4EF8|nr:hypothetical protein [Synechococcus sp. CBW1002]